MLHTLVKKTNLKILSMDISKVLDDIKAIFEPIDLKFYICRYISDMHDTHCTILIFFLKNFIDYFDRIVQSHGTSKNH